MRELARELDEIASELHALGIHTELEQRIKALASAVRDDAHVGTLIAEIRQLLQSGAEARRRWWKRSEQTGA